MHTVMFRSKLKLAFFAALVQVSIAFAQPQEKFIRISVTPDHKDWLYKTGEKVRFNVAISQSGLPVPVTNINYSVMPEKMKAVSSGSLNLQNGAATIEGGTMKTPGFLRCEVEAEWNGRKYRGIGTAAFEPGSIQPTVSNPADFQDFWNNARAELSKVPISPKMVLIPEKCTENINVYHVSFRNINNSRIFGILCIPKKEGKYPALLQVPGAGIRPYAGDIARAEKGIITLQIGIHGIPVNMDPDVYLSLSEGALNGYPAFNLDNRESYYYKRVYLGCVRSVDFLANLPQTDASRIGITGGSQGGALSIITAALDSRIKYLAAFYPALSDMTGYLENRAGGWPHLFSANNLKLNNTKEKLQTVPYYDVVNFARLLKIPGYYSWGFNDETCPPTSMYSVFNVITAPRELMVVPETGHWTYPEQNEALSNWIMSKLQDGK
jgi:cephalosporin-C deacetylase